MHKIAVMGDKHSVLGFRTLGISVYPVEKENEAERILHQLAEEGYVIIYIIEQLANQIASAVERYTFKKYPVVVPIPGALGSLGIGRNGIKKSVERAVGADILFRDG